jgi:hypothetical protein
MALRHNYFSVLILRSASTASNRKLSDAQAQQAQAARRLRDKAMRHSSLPPQ